jgi:glycosyltransferase involved in cell wall biosynthesis
MKRTIVGLHTDHAGARLAQTLSALRANTPEPHEVLLLLDGREAMASAAAEPVLQGMPHSGSADRLGAPASFNRLVSREQAELYVFLEDGAEVGPGWLGAIIAGLSADPRNGLAGPSTNRCWNAQGLFPNTRGTALAIAQNAQEALQRFGRSTRTLDPLHSLADFCYAVRREVIDAIGLADERFGLGPCWEMDYNIRALRAGWRGVWVCGAYVHRSPSTEHRQRDEARLFDTNKRRYQDKFCGGRLRGEKNDYRSHCRGEACPNFAPVHLIQIRNPPEAARVRPPARSAPVRRAAAPVDTAPLVTCIMPTCDRQRFVPGALRLFLRQDYPNLELIVVDDGRGAVASLLPDDPRVRLIRLPEKKNVGVKRNLACAAAAGEFIIHWDDDDWYPADRVRRQLAALQTGRAEICGTSTLYYYDAASRRAWCYRYQQGNRPWVAGNTLAYRTAWWKAHPFPEIQVGEDSRFVWAAPRTAVCDLNAPDLCVARIHPQNTSRKSQTGACWRAYPSAGLEAVLGSEWPNFAGLPATAPPLESDWPLVSCIMPTHNRRAFLPLALKAFESQDYPAKELIVVDDGSDPIGDLLEKISTARYIRLPERISIGAKRNLACTEARGAIIAHWDDDDWYAPQRLRWQVAPLLAGEADLTGLENSFMLELPGGRFWNTQESLHRRMFVGDVHGGTLVFWKRLFTDGMRYPPRNIAEDAAFIQTAVRKGKKLVRVRNDGLFVYMRHGGNAWRFKPGSFLDPSSWRATASPNSFGPTELEAWQNAASLGAQPQPL